MEHRKLYLCRKCLNNAKDKIRGFGDYHCSGIIYTSPKNDKRYYYGINFYYDDYDGKCPCCGEPLETMQIDLVELYNITDKGSPNPDYVLAMNDLKKNNIIEYTEKYNQLINQQHNSGNNEQEQESNQVRCPRCGSTQITTGQRGYSLFSGFLGSNKTVNRCANCGYSWKPGK